MDYHKEILLRVAAKMMAGLLSSVDHRMWRQFSEKDAEKFAEQLAKDAMCCAKALLEEVNEDKSMPSYPMPYQDVAGYAPGYGPNQHSGYQQSMPPHQMPHPQQMPGGYNPDTRK